jgi:hypothetical protein
MSFAEFRVITDSLFGVHQRFVGFNQKCGMLIGTAKVRMLATFFHQRSKTASDHLDRRFRLNMKEAVKVAAIGHLDSGNKLTPGQFSKLWLESGIRVDRIRCGDRER